MTTPAGCRKRSWADRTEWIFIYEYYWRVRAQVVNGSNWPRGLDESWSLCAARATDYTLNDLTLVRIRAVGDYQSGDNFDNTIELWFSESIAGRAGPNCTDGRRVFIQARHYQMVTAAYAVFLKGKKVSVNIDDTLPIRYGACEISFLDITSS